MNVRSRILPAIVSWSVILVVGCIAFTGTAATAYAQWNELNPVIAHRTESDGELFTMKRGLLKVQVCTERMVRVLFAPDSAFPERKEYVVLRTAWPAVAWTREAGTDTVLLKTSCMIVRVSLKDGAIQFCDSTGTKLFGDDSRTLTPAVVNGEKTWRAEVFSSLWGSYESFYGLGGHQAGVWNYRGESVDLSQDNTNISIPFFTSSRGYGIFWNNSSRSRFNNRFLNALFLSSEVADVVDYYFIYGPAADTLIAGYRMLTGDAPLFGKWAYGFWQCKNRYASQEEILSVAAKYRERHLPIDNIVQDWFWWYTMGEPVFDRSRYPDPAGMVERLHRQNFHVMISVWPYFRPGTGTYDDMDRRGFFIDRTRVAGFHPAGQALYDAFNPEARKYYWNLIDTALFRIGFDAWWLDTTEPETEGRETNILVTNRVAAGNGARYANLYPLMTTTGVYEGQRAVSADKRVFILSRSAFAGSQRTAAAVWSGDVNSDWTFFRKQIPSGLNCSLSGLPYWTTDIGGFLLGDPDSPAYRELFVRWFQFGAFCPVFRVHGTRSNNQNELWSYGPAAEKILADFTRLRYRLLPYVYSLAWKTTNSAYTPMRALAMDFGGDVRASGVGDQFLFGPALMVNPVTEPSATSRRVYLPTGKWFDFWTGKSVEGGRAIEAPAPLERIPLFVRGGSIIPLGPHLEWSSEKPADPLEVRVYPGGDADFTLYEDEGDSYNYERGAFATIRFHWDDASGTLTVGAREGSFPGMLRTRAFRIVFVSSRHGAGPEPERSPDRTVQYDGTGLRLSLKRNAPHK